VVDEGSRRILDNVAKEDDILNENVTSETTQPEVSTSAHSKEDIEQIEKKRPMNPTTDAVYLISPLAHIVDCLMADFEKRKYRRSFLIWTTGLECATLGQQYANCKQNCQRLSTSESKTPEWLESR
jgi:syntaxin-binding protein 1